MMMCLFVFICLLLICVHIWWWCFFAVAGLGRHGTVGISQVALTSVLIESLGPEVHHQMTQQKRENPEHVSKS